MKKLNIIYLAMLMLFCSSCNDWLTVEPKKETSADKMFESELGFTTALTGLYLGLQSIYSPGDFMMGGNIEEMAHNYTAPSGSGADYYSYTHDYGQSNFDSSTGAVFLYYYKVIANANMLLQALESQDVLTQDEAKLIKAETLAIRAYCHFELLRLWGPIPDQANTSTAYLPYVTTYSIDQYPYTPYNEYVKHIETDFSQARELLAESDPIVKYSNTSLNTSYATLSDYKDMFWYNRQKRFNYYGVTALMARFFLWTNNTADAYTYAKEVVNATNPDGSSKFRLGNRADCTAGDYLFYPEHLVGMDITDDGGANRTYFSTGILGQNDKLATGLFESKTELRISSALVTTTTSRDYSTWPISYKTVTATLKYSYMTSSDYDSNSYGGHPKSISLIRLSEMYMILMEVAPLTEAQGYCNTFRRSREASYASLTESNRKQEVLKEYAREYWAEGQTFFAHKRMKATNLVVDGSAINEGSYVLPLPTDETTNSK